MDNQKEMHNRSLKVALQGAGLSWLTPHTFIHSWVPGALSSGVKRLGCEADHSPPASAEVKKMWIYTSTPPIRLHGVVLN
jgi:hypothetical protein